MQLRSGCFIAESILRSLVLRGVMTPAEVQDFQRSVPTIASELVYDVDRYVGGQLDQDEFLEKYGHLRPGTYDILSWRYDQRLGNLTAAPTQRRVLFRLPPSGMYR